MSQRVKRPNRSEDGSIPVKRRKRPTTEEEEASLAAAAWQPRPLNDLKGIYNRSTTEAPAELFRKDLISAMKLPDSEPLASNEYWIIVDQWKQEWERGVQVPVNPDSLPEPSVTVTCCQRAIKPTYEFKLPKNKYIRITKDQHFKPDEHMLSTAPAQSEAACSYDLDETDIAWLKILNAERAAMGLAPVFEDQLERVIERFELSCWDKIQSILRNEEGLGIEYDENVICDVCRSPDSEEGNEMVFCDSCNICVHQACYGITRIPEGQWLCCTCALGQRPECVLCPNKGGAMKCTRSGQKWAHVSCALWIPEVSIGCVERMEPITKISSIPQSRWALICVLCRERVGACIQCSVKTCKTAYHVTCAFKHGLEMRAIIEDENADDGVKLRSYCEKHSKSSKKEKSICSGSEDDDCKRKKRKDMTSEEKNQARAQRLQEIEAEFYKHVSIKDVSIHVNVDMDALRYIFNYWKLKRKAGLNKPLLPPKSEDVEMLSHKQEQADIEKMKMFVQLRQDLERVRNLCYMVNRREKLSRSFFRTREQTFHKQAAVLNSDTHLPNSVVQAVIEANHGPSIYDRLYSHNDAEDHTDDFEAILSRIIGLKDDKKPEINGLFKDVRNNPYKNMHFNNGSTKKRGSSLYGGSSLSNTSSADEQPKANKENRISSDEERKPVSRKRPSKAVERRKNRLQKLERTRVKSSSEEDVRPPKSWSYTKSRLSQMESELGASGSDSDELMPIRPVDTHKVKAISIYSDSDSTDDSSRNDRSSSNQNKLRTKAAVKEFSPSKSPPPPKKKVQSDSKRESASKKKDFDPSELIVPQRQAAKKASENMKCTTTTRVKEQDKSGPEQTAVEQPKVVAVSNAEEKVVKVKSSSKSKPLKEPSRKDKEKVVNDVFDLEKELDKADAQEILAYVPQRQAAKKAAEHIKSGMGKPAPPEAAEQAKKELEKVPQEKPVRKEAERPKSESDRPDTRKSSSNSSSSSSSSSSGDTSSSSSSDSEPERQKSSPERQKNSPVETERRTSTRDRPFLDKVPVSLRRSSSSDSSDSRTSSPSKVGRSTTTAPATKKAVDKRPVRKEQQQQPTRSARGRGRPSVGDADVRRRDMSDSKRSNVDGEERRDTGQRDGGSTKEITDKKVSKSDKLRSPKEERKSEDTGVGILEREILERKSSRESLESKPINKIVTSPEKKEKDKPPKVQAPEPVVEVKETASKKGPTKTKSIEDIFAKKLTTEKKKEPLPEEKVEKPPKEATNKSEIEKEKKSPIKPSTFQNRSIFSPQPHNKENDLLDFDLLDDGFSISKEEEIMKGPLTFNFANIQLFKEDSKEDSARETLNLVEKLRLEMSKKTGYDVDDSVSVASSTKNDLDKTDFNEQVVPNNTTQMLQKDDDVPKDLPATNVEVRLDVSITPSTPGSFEQPTSRDYKYLPSQPEVPPEIDKTAEPLIHASLDHSTNVQADERWVPPSEAYPNLTAENYPEPALELPENTQQYLQPYMENHLPNASMLSLEHEKNASPCLSDRRVTQTPFTDPASMDCMPSPSPYANLHPQAKWAESIVMPIRRSSSSSTGSTSSSCSHRNEPEDEAAKVMMQPNQFQEIPYGILPPPFPPSLDTFQQFADPTPFINPVSLFPASNINPQIPFSSPGGAMYPPFPSVIPPLTKPVGEAPPVVYPSPCTAAFTSSQHNMALTAAMVNMPATPIKDNSMCIEQSLTNAVEEPAVVSNEVPLAPIVNSNESPIVNNETLTSPSPSHKNNSTSGKKSPSKPTRTSARFTAQQKSPNKSPGKSPRQLDTVTKNNTVRGRGDGKRGGRGAQHGRGRGRGRGRPRNTPQHNDTDANTIHNKLVGTVYDLDFDDDISNDNMADLKAMRERRKSIDVHEKKSDTSTKDSTPITSPQSKTQKYNSDLRSLKPPSPSKVNSEPIVALGVPEEPPSRAFTDIVQPVLPGPVDMRTYNSTFDQQNYNEANLLGAFESGTASSQVHEEIDEDFEKELHSALTATSNKKIEEPPAPEVGNIKVSLSDARNQLKVKIKGPIANYTSSVAALPPPVVDPSVVSNVNVAAVSNNVISNVSVNSGTSSLRRMRKKELLRQYWTQDMNMDDPTSAPRLANAPATPTINRTIITIPKAVASMTTIPTKDDYRDYRTDMDDSVESKSRKDKSGGGRLSRELRHLDLPLDDENHDRKRNASSQNIGNNLNSSFDSSNKRRGRPPRPTQPVAPKLKIKIGNSVVDDRRDRLRPPKKRLANITKPSVEDLKRESMKFRKRVMADFSEEKRKKKDKSKKKRKLKPEVQIISNNSVNPTKLIIKFGKKSDVERTSGETRTGADNNNSSVVEQAAEKPMANSDCGETSALRIVTPIKLKLSRCQEGVGYVMKNEVLNCENDSAPPAISLPDPVHTSTPLPLNKDCEVR